MLALFFCIYYSLKPAILVSVEGITYSLMFKIFKPRSCLQEGDKYNTKPELAVEIIQGLKAFGF
jgi:SRSO17 transposase